MARPRGSKNKVTKSGTLSPEGFHGGIQDPNSGANAFSIGMNKTASLEKTGEYPVTQTQSFFYSPELNIMGSLS